MNGGSILKKISREEAEKVFQKNSILSTRIEQDNKALRIYFQISEKNFFLMQYNFKNREKYYFLKEAPI